MLAGSTGLEPAASGVTGRRSNHSTPILVRHQPFALGNQCGSEVASPSPTVTAVKAPSLNMPTTIRISMLDTTVAASSGSAPNRNVVFSPSCGVPVLYLHPRFLAILADLSHLFTQYFYNMPYEN